MKSRTVGATTAQATAGKKEQTTKLQLAWKYVKRDKYLYLLLLPIFAYYFIFKYTPMFGEIIAFKNYRFADGIWGVSGLA